MGLSEGLDIPPRRGTIGCTEAARHDPPDAVGKGWTPWRTYPDSGEQKHGKERRDSKEV
jgi:hypothetical protein